MPQWGRPPGGSSGVGRYYEGVVDDVYRFQDLGSDEEELDGVVIDGVLQPALNGKRINPDELYFNDMDIRAWESRTSALEEPTHGRVHGRRGYQEEHFGGAGNTIPSAETEERLFQRVLDKIRVARAAGNTDVSLSAEELDAYQSRLYGARASAVRPEPEPRPTSVSVSASTSASASVPNDTASVMSYETTGKHGASSSRSKKSQPRTSMFGSKAKKERRHSGHRRTSTNSTTESHALAPGFVVPGADGQGIYAPINAYEGSLARDQRPLRAASRRASDTSHHAAAAPNDTSPRNMLGSFPESEYDYGPSTPAWEEQKSVSRPSVDSASVPLGSRSGPPSIASSRLVPFPVEPYQYHQFSTSSSSLSPTSPQPQYTRRMSLSPSEASYTSVPRRIPAASPGYPPVPVPLQRVTDGGTGQGRASDPPLGTQSYGAGVPVQGQQSATGSGSGRGGEKRRSGGKGRK
ncbi:uncharacterized protein SETTUDRAFT_81368, partial [Exserohilum turcica Et28A]